MGAAQLRAHRHPLGAERQRQREPIRPGRTDVYSAKIGIDRSAVSDDLAGAASGHGADQRVIGIEHGGAAGGQRRDELAHLRGDGLARAVGAQVVVANYGDDSHLGLEQGERVVQVARPVFAQLDDTEVMCRAHAQDRLRDLGRPVEASCAADCPVLGVDHSEQQLLCRGLACASDDSDEHRFPKQGTKAKGSSFDGTIHEPVAQHATHAPGESIAQADERFAGGGSHGIAGSSSYCAFDSRRALERFECTRVARRDRRVDGHAIVRIEGSEHVLQAIERFAGASDTDLDPPEGVGLKRFEDRGNAAMPSRAAARAAPDGADGDVEIVVHENALIGVERHAFCKLFQNGTGMVHGGPGLDQAHKAIPRSAACDPGLGGRLPGEAEGMQRCGRRPRGRGCGAFRHGWVRGCRDRRSPVHRERWGVASAAWTQASRPNDSRRARTPGGARRPVALGTLVAERLAGAVVAPAGDGVGSREDDAQQMVSLVGAFEQNQIALARDRVDVLERHRGRDRTPAGHRRHSLCAP